ncbi:hypothetical protein L195_g044542, partial [Trifolium pratense]
RILFCFGDVVSVVVDATGFMLRRMGGGVAMREVGVVHGSHVHKLAFVGIGATPSGEDYWKSVWPNTPLPKAFYDLLLPY